MKTLANVIIIFDIKYFLFMYKQSPLMSGLKTPFTCYAILFGIWEKIWGNGDHEKEYLRMFVTLLDTFLHQGENAWICGR